MNSSPELPEKLQDDLVAYLDGESNEAVTQEIEQSLMDSAEIRQDVEALSRTWQMLDFLPHAAASDDFTQRTLSTIQLQEVGQNANDGWLSGRARRGVVLAISVAGLALSASFGFLVAHRWPSESDQVVNELPLIKNLDVYTEIDNVAFLKELQESGLFDDKPE